MTYLSPTHIVPVPRYAIRCLGGMPRLQRLLLLLTCTAPHISTVWGFLFEAFSYF